MATTSRIDVLRNIARNRCCSFCRSTSHTINNCDDQRLVDFEELCLVKKILFDQMQEIVDIININENSENNFRQWILEKYLENQLLVKTFAVSKCRATVRSTALTVIQLIIDYFYYSDLPELINAEEDFIPFNTTPPIINRNLFSDAIIGLLILSQQSNNIEIIYPTIFNINNLYTIPVQNTKIVSKMIEEERTSDEECECGICYENYKKQQFVKLSCNHEFCSNCIKTTLVKNKLTMRETTCAYCREKVLEIVSRTEEVKILFDELVI
jgi:hypothetical protein